MTFNDKIILPIGFHLPSFGSYFSAVFIASLRLIPPTAYITWCEEAYLRGRIRPDIVFSFGNKRNFVASKSKSLKSKISNNITNS